jgi:predicted Zn-dependent peptidase
MDLIKIVFISILIMSNLYADEFTFSEVANTLKSSIKKVKFENGLTLLMMKRTNSPTLALYTKFKVGSVDETPEMAGTAHLLEHMLFKGTENVGTTNFQKEKKYYALMKTTGSELDMVNLEIRNLESDGKTIPTDLSERQKRLKRRLSHIIEKQSEYIVKAEDNFIYEQNGQVGFNAYTSHDVTNYQIKLPSNRIEIWAKMESDRLKNPIFREYYTERDVIMEERKMRIENRGMGILREKYLQSAFIGSPYGRPVIGYDTNIPFLDINETETFFRTYYTPDNMVIAIVGDLEFSETESLIQKYFGDLTPSKHYRKEQRIQEKFNSGERRVSFKHPGGSSLIIGFNKPNFFKKESHAFEFVDYLLTKGATSRLYKKLVIDKKLCTGVSAWASDPGERYSNLFSVFFTLNNDTNPKEVEDLFFEEIEKLKSGEISDDELQKIKNKSTASFLREVDSNASLADGLSFYELVYGNWEELFLSYDGFNSVTKEEISSVVSKYFVKENMTIGHLDSRGMK